MSRIHLILWLKKKHEPLQLQMFSVMKVQRLHVIWGYPWTPWNLNRTPSSQLQPFLFSAREETWKTSREVGSINSEVYKGLRTALSDSWAALGSVKVRWDVGTVPFGFFTRKAFCMGVCFTKPLTFHSWLPTLALMSTPSHLSRLETSCFWENTLCVFSVTLAGMRAEENTWKTLPLKL